MTWPTPQDFNEAIQHPATNLGDPELKRGTLSCNKLGLPSVISGNFASVYRVTVGQTSWAVRCFLRDVPDAKTRYSAIDRVLRHVQLPYTVPFSYEPHGILVRGTWYPIVKMEWTSGVPLDVYVRNHLHSPIVIRSLATKWLEMTSALNRAGIAHGDLQHGNILIVNDQLKLVDYDGMFVPDLAGVPSNELGHSNYQHPGRSSHDFSPALDHFSAWVIYLSLYALSLDPETWQVLKGGDECLLLRKADLLAPARSHAFRVLAGNSDPTLQSLANQVLQFLTMSPLQVPPLTPSTSWVTVASAAPPKTDPANSVTSRIGTGAARTPAWYQQREVVEPAPSPIPQSVFPSMPAPRGRQHSLGVRSWLPATSAPVTPFHYAPTPIWHRALALASLLSVVITPFSLAVLPEISLLCVLVIFTGIAVTVVRYRSDEAVREKRLQSQRLNQIGEGADPVSAEIQRLERARSDVVRQYEAALEESSQQRIATRGAIQRDQHTATISITTQITALDNKLRLLAQKEQEELRKALAQRQSAHVTQILQNYPVLTADIPNVGDMMKHRLVQAGIRSAAQVSHTSVRSVYGFGDLRTRAVVSWAERYRLQAERTMPTHLSPADKAHIEQQFIKERRQAELDRARLQGGLSTELTRISHEHMARCQQRDRELIAQAVACVNRVVDLDRQLDTKYREQHEWQQKVEQARLLLQRFADINFSSYASNLVRKR